MSFGPESEEGDTPTVVTTAAGFAEVIAALRDQPRFALDT